MEVLAVSLGRNILNPKSRDRVRMAQYAKHLDAYHIIVLTTRQHGYHYPTHEGALHVYPTNSCSRYTMLIDAFCIGRKIAHEMRSTDRVITAQDPLEIGWLSFVLAKVTGIPLHIQVHGDYFSTDAWCGHSWLRRVRRLFALMLLRQTATIRVVSLRIRDSLVERGLSPNTVTVLPIRSELEVFLRTSYVYRTVPPYTFLFIGRLAPEKNIQRIVRAFALVHTRIPEVRLHIVGRGSEEDIIADMIRSQHLTDVVTLFPWTEDVSRELARTDIFLLASFHEAYALTLVEAMSVGLPLITTDVGCVGEVVQDGVHGIVVREFDDASYARAMERMVTDSEFRIQCGKNGKETAGMLASYTEEEYAKAWVTSLSLGK